MHFENIENDCHLRSTRPRMRTSRVFVMLFVALLSWCFHSRNVGAYNKFTNIECKAFDKAFADFRYCQLKVLRRGVIGLEIYVELYQLPVTNISINLSLWKRASGYRPFMYNASANFCEFMTNRKRFPFLKIFFDILAKDSNINHTCPYNNDIIVHNLELYDYMLAKLPLPSGDYMFKLIVGAYNNWKANVKAYFTRNEDI